MSETGRRFHVAEPAGDAYEIGWHNPGWHTPDLSDPATLGCLLALVREAWGDDSAVAYNEYRRIYYTCDGDRTYSEGEPSEAAALVAALEAAP